MFTNRSKSAPLKPHGRGLVNPTVKAGVPSIPPMAAQTAQSQRKTSRTHIPEPRWQQIISLIVLAIFVIVEVYFWFSNRP